MRRRALVLSLLLSTGAHAGAAIGAGLGQAIGLGSGATTGASFEASTVGSRHDPEGDACADDLACAEGFECWGRQCRATTRELSDRRALMTMHLKSRANELREELAVGQGPVVRSLARFSDQTERTVGRTLRDNRGEMLAVLGDGSDPTWPERFLVQLEQLCPRPR